MKDVNLIIQNLSDYEVKDIGYIMDEENQMWLDVLAWDYSSTLDFIKNYINMKVLPGLVVVVDDRPVGYAFMVVEGDRAIIGNIYVLKEFWGMGIEAKMAEQLAYFCKTKSGIERVEAQIFLFSEADLTFSLESLGFKSFRREFMSIDIQGIEEVRSLPEGYRLGKLKHRRLEEVAKVIFRSYQGGIDTEFASSFATMDRCIDFVQNIVSRRGCGEYMKNMTTVAYDEKDQIAGVVLSTMLSEKAGHLPQISVDPNTHGKGIGAFLVNQSLRQFKKAGFREVSLTVTNENEKAFNWYKRLGFETIMKFRAFVWKSDLA